MKASTGVSVYLYAMHVQESAVGDQRSKLLLTVRSRDKVSPHTILGRFHTLLHHPRGGLWAGGPPPHHRHLGAHSQEVPQVQDRDGGHVHRVSSS